MKVLLSLTLILTLGSATSFAQHRSIQFEKTRKWDELVNQAKREKKLIFLDCSTSWCIPCKKLVDSIFSQDQVADFFNPRYVNAHLDMEKDSDGVALARRYTVYAYPSLLFIDPNSGELVHKLVGFRPAVSLLAGALVAEDPKQNMLGIRTRYNAGYRESKFLRNYMDILEADYNFDMKKEVGLEYLNSLSDQELSTAENWALVRSYIKNPLSKPFKSVMANRYKFYQIASKAEVDNKLEDLLRMDVYRMFGLQSQSNEAKMDANHKNELIAYLKSIDFNYAPTLLVFISMSEYAAQKDYRNVLNKMYEAYKYNLLHNVDETVFMYSVVNVLNTCSNQALKSEGSLWIEKHYSELTDAVKKKNFKAIKDRLLVSTR